MDGVTSSAGLAPTPAARLALERGHLTIGPNYEFITALGFDKIDVFSFSMGGFIAQDLVVKHPVTPNDTITKGEKDPKAVNLKDRLSDAINWLAPPRSESRTRWLSKIDRANVPRGRAAE